jgi:hypothetical protein
MLETEDGGSTLSRNIGKLILGCTASHNETGALRTVARLRLSAPLEQCGAHLTLGRTFSSCVSL